MQRTSNPKIETIPAKVAVTFHSLHPSPLFLLCLIMSSSHHVIMSSCHHLTISTSQPRLCARSVSSMALSARWLWQERVLHPTRGRRHLVQRLHCQRPECVHHLVHREHLRKYPENCGLISSTANDPDPNQQTSLVVFHSGSWEDGMVSITS